ncbi:MAG: hypothetical protein HYX92_07285 [Chloroflexi bacterium]|nr:hypothetical protein [Chloroflexota bacterium]
MHALRLHAVIASAVLLLSVGCQGTPQYGQPGTPGVNEIPWSSAQGFILRGEVSQVTQTQSRRVILLLRDGRTIVTESRIDEVRRLIQICGERCSDIVVATE